MPFVGTISANSNEISFLSMNFPSGHPEDRSIKQAEELLTPGISGRRWRTIHAQFPSFQMVTTVEATDYQTAVVIKQRAELFPQLLAKLTIVTSAGAFFYKNVHVSDVRAQCFPGPVYGANTGVNTAHLEIAWTLELTEFGARTL